ncbi:hypothetical protein GGI35DRAFT_119357 [Trichoderma velutinum]
MDQTIKTLKRPFTAVRQMWEDYQVGRAIRERALKSDTEEEKCKEECGEKCPATCNGEDKEECKEEHDEQPNAEREEECKDGTLDEREESSDLNEDQCNDNKVSSQPAEYSTGKQYSGSEKRKWKHNMGAEFPWRYEQLVDGESNWRGTWVLEVKDLRAMKWGTEIVPTRVGNRKGRKIVRKPTRQLPFPIGQERSLLPSEGGQESSLLQSEGGHESSPLTLEGDQDDLMVWLGKS